jgi:tol-pal system protein YbgF
MASFFLLFNLIMMPGAWAQTPAPVIEAGSQSEIQSIEERLRLVEKRLKSQTMVDVLNRLESLQQEIQHVVGNMEVQAHDVDSMKKRQRDLYLDIDRRLQAVENALDAVKAQQKALVSSMAQPAPASTMPVSPTGAPAPSATTPTTSSSASSGVDRQLEREAYQRAFNMLKDGRYKLAMASFKAFLETYPHAEYADNAQYWLGEANYVQKRYKDAITEFQKVLDHYPTSNKRPDALLKMGYTYELLNDIPQATNMLSRVVKEFPASTAAQLATKRLQDMKSTH